MKKFKIFILVNIIAIFLINNLFLFFLSNRYAGLNKIISPHIVLNINRYGNTEGITFNPMLLISKTLKSNTQKNFQMLYIFLTAIIFMAFTYKKRELTSHGTAKFATKDEIKKMGITHNEDDGVVLGMTEDNKIITHNGQEHILNMAPTRTGKGVCCVLPTLWTWKSSVIVNDIKGECWELTSGYRRSILNQKCIFFNPMDDTGEGISYNPLALVKVGTRSEQEDARIIATTLIDIDGKGENDHWITSAINLLTAVILHVKYVNVNASFIDVIGFLEDPKEPLVDKIGNVIAKELNEYGDVVDKTIKDDDGEIIGKDSPFDHFNSLKKQKDDNLSFLDLYMKNTTLHPVVGSTFITMFSTPDKERGSIFSTCINKLSIFKDPRVMLNIKKSDILPKDLKENKISLYLVTPPKAIYMTRPLFRLILTQTIYELTDKLEFKNRKKIDIEKTTTLKEKLENFIYKENEKKEENKKLLFLIDEFPSLGNLKIFEEALAYIGGYGLKFLIIAQSINQLNKIYSKSNSIIDNCRVQLYFTPNDENTPKMISDMMGNFTKKIITRSGKGFLMEHRSESFQGRPLMTASEVRVLPYEKTLLLLSGQNPILGKKIFWYEHKKYKTNADYNIPYLSYLNLLKKIEKIGGNEYILEYIIYLTKDYKTLKNIVNKAGIDNFIKNIMKNDFLEKEIERMEKLTDKEKNRIKQKILKEKIRVNHYKKNDEKLKELEKDIDMNFQKYLKNLFFTSMETRKELEKSLKENLEKIQGDIEPKTRIQNILVTHFKEKNIKLDIPEKFIEEIFEIEKYDKDIVKKVINLIDMKLKENIKIEFEKLLFDLKNEDLEKLL